MNKLTRLIYEFKESLGSSASHRTYRHSVSTLAKFLNERQLDAVYLEILVDLAEWLSTSYTGSTVAGYMSVFRKFLDWLHLNGHLDAETLTQITSYNRTMGLSLTTHDRRDIEVDDLEKILQYAAKPVQISETDFSMAIQQMIYMRARALLYTLAYSGLRISEALQLKAPAIRKFLAVNGPNKQFSTRIEGKGNKYRTIVLLPISIRPISQYLDKRTCYFPQFFGIADDFSPLFISLTRRGRQRFDRQLTRQAAFNDLTGLAAACGVDSFASPHAYRHFWGELLAESGAPIHEIANALGNTIEVASRNYLRRPDARKLGAIGEAAIAAKENKSKY